MSYSFTVTICCKKKKLSSPFATIYAFLISFSTSYKVLSISSASTFAKEIIYYKHKQIIVRFICIYGNTQSFMKKRTQNDNFFHREII